MLSNVGVGAAWLLASADKVLPEYPFLVAVVIIQCVPVNRKYPIYGKQFRCIPLQALDLAEVTSNRDRSFSEQLAFSTFANTIVLVRFTNSASDAICSWGL